MAGDRGAGARSPLPLGSSGLPHAIRKCRVVADHEQFSQTGEMSTAEEFFTGPDPDGVLSTEDLVRLNRDIDLSGAEGLRMSRSVEDENGEFVPVSANAPTMMAPIPSQRCEHQSERTGRRCKRWAVRGLRLCSFHGTFDESTMILRDFVLEYARRDLYRMAPMALDVMEELMTDEDVSPAVRLKAATETLDRIGVRGGTEMDVRVETTVADPAAEIRARLDRLAPLAVSAVPEEPDSGDPEITDAVLTDP